MQPIFNEWQLESKLNCALQQQHRADFGLWLAMLSPAVDEMAAFQTPVPRTDHIDTDLYQRLSVNKMRSPCWQRADDVNAVKYSEAAQISLAQLKLQHALTPEPWVWQDSPKKLSAFVIASLPLHCQRRLQGIEPKAMETDETALYDILTQLHE